MDVSVVISTRNRARSCAATLQALVAQTVPAGIAWEIIVADNGSTDGTDAIVEAWSAGSPLPCRYVLEARRGVSFARNAGLAAARGDIVAFLDDDVRPDTTWLGAVVAEFRGDPTLTALAGRVTPATPTSLQVAMTRSLDRHTISRDQFPEGLILGCNLAVRREAALALGGFDTRLGAGRGLSCDDIDFAYRTVRAGYHMGFSPLPVVYHDPQPRRRAYLRGWGAFYLKFLVKGDHVIARLAWWEASRLFRELRATGRHGRRRVFRELRELVVGAAIMARRLPAALWQPRSPVR